MGSSTKLIPSPTIREESGLAMSSRNMRLTPEAKETAVVISQTLQEIKGSLGKQPVATLKSAAVAKLEHAGFTVDYVEIADALTLELVEEWDGKRPLVALVAAFIGGIRLIDNLVLTA